MARPAIQNAAIIGLGSMGPGMAARLARGGLRVSAYDTAEAARDRAATLLPMAESVMDALGVGATGDGTVEICATLEAAVAGADLVIENVPENVDVKAALYRDLEPLITGETLVATDTSGIPITKLQAHITNPARFVGMHWSNPPHIIPMIEVIAGAETAPATVTAIRDLISGLGLLPVLVKKDVPGFVENRVLYALLRECVDLVEQGVIDAEGLDTVVRFGIGMKLAVVGPMRLLDMAGLDIYQSVASFLNAELCNRADVSPMVTEATDSGRLGMKTAGGLFPYDADELKRLPAERAKALVAVRRALEADSFMIRLEQHLAGPLRALLGTVLIAMVAINVVNATGRYAGFRLPAGLDELLVYMMIWIVMAGAVLALLQREHLAIDLLPQAMRTQARCWLVLLGDVVVLAISVTVARQSWAFIERIDRLGQTSMGLGIPMTWPHAAVLAGFGGMSAVALLLIVRDVAALRGHGLAKRTAMIWTLAGTASVLIALGTPIFAALLAGVILVIVFVMPLPLLTLQQIIFGGLDVYALLAIPFFVLAGELMARAGIADRLLAWVEALFGQVPGALGVAAVGGSTLIGTICGSSAAAVAAVGRTMHTRLVDAGYGRARSAGLITAGGAIDIVIPPSIAMILYGVAAEQSIPRLFIAGILPGLLIALMMAGFIVWVAWRRGIRTTTRIGAHDILAATSRAALALAMPVFVLGGIYGGFFSPTEAGGFAAAYAILIGTVVYRSLGLAGLVDAAGHAAMLTAKIMIVVAAASAIAWLLTVQGVPQALSTAVSEAGLSPLGFLVAVNLLLLAIGCFLDPTSSILVLAPLLTPIAIGLGIDPIHFGVVMTVNLAIGMFTPPFGLNIFVAQAVMGVSAAVIWRGVLPFMVVQLLALAIITAVPELSLVLTRTIG